MHKTSSADLHMKFKIAHLQTLQDSFSPTVIFVKLFESIFSILYRNINTTVVSVSVQVPQIGDLGMFSDMVVRRKIFAVMFCPFPCNCRLKWKFIQTPIWK